VKLRNVATDDDEADLLAQARAGDRLSLQRLLVRYQGRLVTRIRRKLPRSLGGAIAAEDVLQETLIEVFRGIGGFEPVAARGFFRWIATIADHRVIDIVRGHRAAKRGGGRIAVDPLAGGSSVAPLLELLQVHSHTPSRSAAGRELELALRAALAGLKDEYRQALELRFLKGLSVAETAAKMRRTEMSIHKLCSRGLQRLRESLGEASRYLSR